MTKVTGRKRVGDWLLCAVVGLAATDAAVADDASPAVRRDFEEPESAQAALQRAAKLRAQARDTTGEKRAALQRQAVEAYRGVRNRWPQERLLGAEGAFRAGELLRARDESQAARAEFEAAWQLGAGSAFKARAGLELGHLSRRESLFEEACAAYRLVLEGEDLERPWRDDAALWAGRMHAAVGRRTEALHLWERMSRQAESPLDRIQAFDYLALDLIEQRDLEGAAGMLDRCRVALNEVALEETSIGERVRNGLARMRAIHRLETAVAERSEGVKIEKRTGG